MRGLLFMLLFIFAERANVFAQGNVNPYPYTNAGTTYLQSFDGLPSAGTFSFTGKGPFNLNSAPVNGNNLTGWQIWMNAGSNANIAFATGTGSSATTGLYSLGAAGIGERALGSLSSGSGIYSMGLILTNQAGTSLNSFTINFTAEQWRKGGSGNKNTWSFRYKTGVITRIDETGLTDEPLLNFSSPINSTGAGSLVGNLPENQQSVSYTVYGINWKPGEQLLLRWDDADETGSDDVVAIDNFSFSASLVSGAPSIISDTFFVAASSAEIVASVNDNYAGTSILVAYDTINTFATPIIIHPDPDTLLPGAGITAVTASLTGLRSGVTYYVRVVAQNSLGAAVSITKKFTTLNPLPSVITTGVSGITTSTAIVAANITITGTSIIVERGIVWAIVNDPTIANNKISSNSAAGAFTQTITDLPQGTVLYARAYAINSAGIAYGNTIRFTTQTIIASLKPTSSVKTNAGIITFNGKTQQNISGLTTANFSLVTTGVSNALITAVTTGNNGFTITVNTGIGSGNIGLIFSNEAGSSLSINNLPFTATGSYTIDKTAPQITTLQIPDNPIKVGDTIPLVISVSPDADIFRLISGNINGSPLSSLLKKDDSTYTATCIMLSGGNDIHSSADIPVNIIMNDVAGNAVSYQTMISHSNDPVDVNKPSISAIQNPVKGLYKAGDTLDFILRFSEQVFVTGTPSLGIISGTKSRTALYIAGSGTDNLLLRHIIPADDLDTDGIKTATTLTVSNATIRDLAGNNASLSINNNTIGNSVLIDAVAPIITGTTIPDNKLYTLGDTLRFTFLFSKSLITVIKKDSPVIKLTIGSTEKNLVYEKTNSNNLLSFYYVVKYGDADKNGISIVSAINLNNSVITDSAGNAPALSFKTTSLSNVKVDAIAPVFTKDADEMITLCSGIPTVINNAFSINDEEAGELVSWRIRNVPRQGSISINSASATSNGKNIIPTGFIYTPYQERSGIDTIITEVTDGTNTSQKMIFITILPPIQQNTISGAQIICEDKLPALITGEIPSGGNGSYKYVWEITGNDSSKFSIASGINDQNHYTPSLLHNNTWLRRRVISGSCNDTSAPVKITVMKNGLWTGNTNNDWQNPNNWCKNTLPTAMTDVFVNAGQSINIKDTAWCNKILLAQGARLSITGILQIYGDADGSEDCINAEKGTLIYNGSFPQKIDGSYFTNRQVNEIIINNNAGLSVTGETAILGNIGLNAGHLQTNDKLLLKAGATIGASAAGTAIKGNVLVQYFIPGGRSSYRMFGHPFRHTISLQMIRDSLDITGEGGNANGFTPTITNQPSAFLHDPFKGNDSAGINAGWLPFTNTRGGGINAWQPYQAIRLLVRGKPGQGLDETPAGDGKNGSYLPSPVTLLLSGNINHGEQEIKLVKGVYPGYHVVANPYAATIDLSRITRNETGNSYWLWDPMQGKHGGYTSFPFNDKKLLEPFGAVIVKSLGMNSSMLFTEQSKTKVFMSENFRKFSSSDYLFIELQIKTDSIFWDRILLMQIDSARTGVDKNDAEKLPNEDVNFYSLTRDQKRLSIDARPISNESIIPLGFQTNETGIFNVGVSKTTITNLSLHLHDKYLDKWMPLETDSTYQFIVTTDTLSKGDNRFEIRTRKIVEFDTASKQNLLVKMHPNPAKEKVVVRFSSVEKANTTIRLLDISGNPLKSIHLGLQKEGQSTIDIHTLLPGIYFMELRNGNSITTKQFIKQ